MPSALMSGPLCLQDATPFACSSAERLLAATVVCLREVEGAVQAQIDGLAVRAAALDAGVRGVWGGEGGGRARKGGGHESGRCR